MFLNKVQLIGHVGKDPAVSATTDGGMVVNFSLATNERSNGQVYTKWHRLVAWNGAAKVAQYLAKGRLVYIEGRLDYNEYKGVVYARIVVSHIQFLDAKKEDSAPAEVGDAAAEQTNSPVQGDGPPSGVAGMTQEALY